MSPVCVCEPGTCTGFVGATTRCRRDVAREKRDAAPVIPATAFPHRLGEGEPARLAAMGQGTGHEPLTPDPDDPRCAECQDVSAAYCDRCAPSVFAAVSSRFKTGEPPIPAARSMWDVAREFVATFGTETTYGGGREVRLRIGDVRLKALDGWKGRDEAIDGVTRELLALTGLTESAAIEGEQTGHGR